MKRAIIVGNGCDVLENANGDKINNYDYVVRMGDFPRIRGYEKHVGTKTNMFRMKWFNYFNVECNIADSNFGEKRCSCDFNYNDILCISHDPDYYIEIASTFQRYERHSLNRSFYYHVGDRLIHDYTTQCFLLQNKNWFFFNSDDMQDLTIQLQEYSKSIRYSNGIEPSGGVCTIWYLLKYFTKYTITITGFDGWRTGHYWKPDTSTFFASHNSVGERLFVKSLIKRSIISVL